MKNKNLKIKENILQIMKYGKKLKIEIYKSNSYSFLQEFVSQKIQNSEKKSFPKEI